MNVRTRASCVVDLGGRGGRRKKKGAGGHSVNIVGLHVTYLLAGNKTSQDSLLSGRYLGDREKEELRGSEKKLFSRFTAPE